MDHDTARVEPWGLDGDRRWLIVNEHGLGLTQREHEILKLIGRFGQQWQKFSDSADKVKRHFDSVQREFDSLTGTRRRALERPLQQLEALRVERNLPVDGELFVDPDLALSAGCDPDDVGDSVPRLANVRELGA